MDKVISSDFYDWIGIDHFTSPFLMKENKFIQSVNFCSTGLAGGKTTRPPFAAFLNAPNGSQVRNLIYFVYANADGSTTGYIFMVAGSEIYLYQIGSGATTWGSAIKTGLTDTTTPFAYATLANLLHLSNGKDLYMTWNPTDGFVTDATAPLARTLQVYQRRIFASNIPGNTSSVELSAVDYLPNYGGAKPTQVSALAAGYSAGVTSITINDPIFAGANNSNAEWTAQIGGTNVETVKVTAQSGTAAPYTLTITALAHNHSADDPIYNISPWYSDPNDTSTANQFFVDPEHNGAVIALDVVNNNLTMHKSSGGLYLYNGATISSPLQTQNPSFNSPGETSISPYAIAQISGIEFYPNFDGIYAYQGGYPNNISYEVFDFIQNMPGSQRNIAPAVAYKNKYFMSLGASVTDKYGNIVKNAILVYDYIMNLWDVYSFSFLPTAYAVFIDSTGNQQLLFGDKDGKTYLFESGTADNGAPNQAILQTRWLDWGAPERTKGIESYSYSTNPGANFQLQYALDWTENWKPLNNVSGMGVSSNTSVLLKNFKSIAFRVIANTLVPMTFYGMTLKVDIGTRRESGRRL